MYRILTIVFAFSCCSQIVTGQDFTGNWSGHYTLGKKAYDYHFTIFQDGKVITGTASTRHKKDSAKYYFNGVIENGEAHLSATSFLYKKGLYCLPKIKLSRKDVSLRPATYCQRPDIP